MFKKKGLIALNTFVLLLLLYLGIFLGSYWFYSTSKNNSTLNLNQEECLNSALTFRSSVIELLSYENSSLVYSNPLSDENLYFQIKNDMISVQKLDDLGLAQQNISTLGINYCLDYEFSEGSDILILFNGSCISIVSN